MAATPPQIGSSVKITSVLGETFSGAVFSFDSESQLLVIEQPSLGDAKGNIRLIRMGSISSCVLIEPPKASKLDPIVLPEINQSEVVARQKRALTKAHEDSMRIGNNVTVYGQAIFDCINKTMPCEWDQQDIVVLNEVRIAPPYTPDHCRSIADDQRLMERTKKVLAGQLHKLQTEQRFAPTQKSVAAQ